MPTSIDPRTVDDMAVMDHVTALGRRSRLAARQRRHQHGAYKAFNPVVMDVPFVLAATQAPSVVYNRTD